MNKNKKSEKFVQGIYPHVQFPIWGETIYGGVLLAILWAVNYLLINFFGFTEINSGYDTSIFPMIIINGVIAVATVLGTRLPKTFTANLHFIGNALMFAGWGVFSYAFFGKNFGTNLRVGVVFVIIAVVFQLFWDRRVRYKLREEDEDTAI